MCKALTFMLLILLFSWIFRIIIYKSIPKKIEDAILLKLAPVHKRNKSFVRSFMNLCFEGILIVLYIIIAINVIYMQKNILTYLYYRFTWVDIALIFPAFYAYLTITGFIIFIFYICFKNKVVSSTPKGVIGKFRYLLELFIWVGVFYNVITLDWYEYSFIGAFFCTLLYSVYNLSYSFDYIVNGVFPYFMFISDFFIMLFLCMLFILAENIIVPTFFLVFVLFSLSQHKKKMN